MNYLDTSFKDFVKNQLIAESKKEKENNKQAAEAGKSKINYDWIKQIQEEFNQLMKDYDNI